MQNSIVYRLKSVLIQFVIILKFDIFLVNSDQTTTQSKFMAVLMVLVCVVLQALFFYSCGCFQV